MPPFNNKKKLIKAISIKQPWAWLIVNGIKKIENRTWRGHHRGALFIHASKTVDPWLYNNLAELPEEVRLIRVPEPEDLPKGGIVGQVNMTDCVHSVAQNDPQKLWFTGPWGFRLNDAKPLDLIPCRGQLGFFVPEDREGDIIYGS